jgi:hypothetical protein
MSDAFADRRLAGRSRRFRTHNCLALRFGRTLVIAGADPQDQNGPTGEDALTVNDERSDAVAVARGYRGSSFPPDLSA